jgi:signal transduction histidine kinase
MSAITRSVSRLAASPIGDWLLAAVLCTAFEFAALGHGVSAGYAHRAMNWLWAAIGAVMTLTVAARRRQPQRTWVVATACASFLLTTHTQLDPYMAMPGESALLVLPAPLVALYTMARTGQRHYALTGSELALVLPLLNLPLRQHWPLHWLLGGMPSWDTQRAYTLGDAVLAAGLLIAAWALGQARQARIAAESAKRTAQEAERAEHDRAVAAEERARIAAELHDITAHHISVVTLQAGAARLLAESGQPPDADLLGGIEAAGRQAMTEIRQALGVIRAGADGAAPLPGLARLPDLTRQMALAGLTVTVDGPADPLPGSADLTAYRIIQEGLANVVRHSAAGAATVTFRRRPGLVQITITDDGPSRDRQPANPGGNGLIGVAERVRGYGGQMQAGPRPSGGFELRAELPLNGIGRIGDPLPEGQQAEPTR